MIKKEHCVSFWESTNTGTSIPCCEPSKYLLYNPPLDDVDGVKLKKKAYGCIELKDCPEVAGDARRCRKLLKQGYQWYLKKPDILSEETELDNLNYYHVVLQAPKYLKAHTCDFYFNRLHDTNILAASCFASDDYGIVLLKFITGKLRCCYLNLKTKETYFQNIVFFNTQCGVKLSNGSIWIIQKPVRNLSEIILVRPKKNFNTCVVTKQKVEVNDNISLQVLLEQISVSKHCLVVSKKQNYLIYDEKREGLLSKYIHFDKFNDMDRICLVGDMALLYEKPQKDVAPVLYIGVTEPEIIVQKKIDFSVCLCNYQQYTPYGFEVSVHQRGMKALVHSGESYIVVVDLIKGVISQILSYVPCFWQHKLSIEFSLDGEHLRLIGTCKKLSKPGWTEYLCVNFRVWNGFTLHDFCKHSILENYNLEEVQQFRLPKYLFMDLARYY